MQFLKFALILLLFFSGFISPVFSADFYWWNYAPNLNFTNPANWVLSPEDVTNPTATNAGTYPQNGTDNVHFTADLTGNAKRLTTTAVVSIDTLFFESTVKFEFAYPITIYGNIQSNGNLTVIGVLNTITMTGPKNATIDLGTSDPIVFGTPFTINKPGAKVELINHDFNLAFVHVAYSRFTLTAGDFYSNGFDITVPLVLFSVLPKDLTGTTLTLTLDMEKDPSTAAANNSGFAADGLYNCDVVSANAMMSFSKNIQFKSLTLNHPTSVALFTASYNGYISNLSILENLTVNTPNLLFRALNNTNGVTSGFASITVGDTLKLQQQANILINRWSTIVPTCALTVKNISLPPAECTGKSTLAGWGDRRILLNITGDPLDTSDRLLYENVMLDSSGAAITASENDNGGGNSGINFTSAVSQDFYWIGGSGEWSDPAHWSNASGGVSSSCIPMVKDNVTFDDNSFNTPDDVVSLPEAFACNDITWNMASGIKQGSLTGDGLRSLSIRANADFSGAVAINTTLNFRGSSGGNYTVYSGTEPVYGSPNIFFVHEGTYTLTSDFLMTTRNPVSHYSGVLNTAGHTMTIGNFTSLNTVTGATREMQFQGSTIHCNDINLSTTDLVYDFSASHFITDGATITTTVGSAFDFNRITCNANMTTNFGNVSTTIDTLTFFADGKMIRYGFTVNTLVLTPNRTYAVPSQAGVNDLNRTVTINDTIISNTSECLGLTLTGNVTYKGIIKNASGKTITIPGAIVTDVKYMPGSDGSNLQVPGGIDGGGNTNIDITAGIAKAYYWVGGAGNWLDPTHWSLTSGVADNPDGCMPSLIDTVYFDGNSFTAPNQTVTVDLTPITIASMFWLPEAGLQTPTFNVGLNTLNLSGSILLAQGMKFMAAPGGTRNAINFTGTNSQILNFNGVDIGNSSINITGKGRFDLAGDIYSSLTYSIFGFSGGDLYTHGFDITTGSVISIIQSDTSYIDLDTSFLNKGSYTTGSQITIVNCENFKHENARLAHKAGILTISTVCPLTFQSLEFGGTVVANQLISAEVMTTLNNTTLNGDFDTDSLNFAGILTVTAGRTVTVHEAVTATTGTPCNKQLLQGSTDAQATLVLNYCNPELVNCDLKNMNVVLPENTVCEGVEQQLHLYGADLGGNTGNIIYDSSLGTSGVILPDYYTVCTPYTLNIGKGNILRWQWQKDGVNIPANQGGTGATLSVTQPGIYTLRATYANLCESSFTITVYFTDIYRTWQGLSTDWKDPANWNPATEPDSCSYVIIPGGLDYYPILEDNQPVCDTIEFQFGGEVKNTHLLTYNGAKVDMQLNSNQWYMLSAPLKNTYSGDFYLNNSNPVHDLSGRGMMVYMMHFNIGNYQTGAVTIPYNWNNAFNTNDVELTAGQGFALFANPKNSTYDDQGELADSPFQFPKNDAFYNYYNIQGAVTGRGKDLDRSQNGRFIYEDVITNGLVPLSHSALATGQMVLFGNPFMAQLDFNAFYTDNSQLIYEEYKIAYGINTGQPGAVNDFATYKGVGGDYITTDPTFDPTLTDYIPPMQSIIVYTREDNPDVNSGQLVADIVNHTVTAPMVSNNPLRSGKTKAASDKSLLYVTAQTATQKSNAVLVLWNEGASNFRPEEDSRKLFDEKTTAPVLVYLLSEEGIALDIHTTNDLSKRIPLGIRTSKAGTITLSFSGMENFTEAVIYLHDTQENKTINLSETEEYAFNKSSKEIYLDDRFFLSFENITSIEDNFNTGVFVSNPKKNTIRIQSSGEIHEVEIRGMDGRMVWMDKNFATYTKDYRVSIPGVYLVRMTGLDTTVKKIVVE